MARKKQKLPFPVGCLAFFMLLGSLIIISFAVVIGMHYLRHDLLAIPKGYWTEFQRHDDIFWIVAVIEGFVMLPTSIGLFAKKRWAYNSYTVINGFAIGLDGYGVFGRHDYPIAFVLVFHALIAVYMLLPGVRKVFA